VQSGNVYKRNGSWHLRFYRLEADGKRARVSIRLAEVGDAYRTKRDVAPLVAVHLTPANAGGSAHLALTLNEYVELHYFPAVKDNLKPSTVNGYRDIFKTHIKPGSLGRVRLRDFKTGLAQQFLDSLQKKYSHQTLLGIRAYLSAVFAHARRTDTWTAVNPLESIRVGGKKTKPERYAYTLEEIQHILKVLPEPARSVCGLAAFSGLREGEIRGLRWDDYTGDKLHVRRAVWRKEVGAAKTEGSETSVPVIGPLRDILDAHRVRAVKTARGRADNYIFSGDRTGFALHLDNLARRVIIPALTPCAVCGELGKAHENESHEFKADKKLSLWHGWHAFRRGLGTNLSELGVPTKVIQGLLRHEDIGTTSRHYIHVSDVLATGAMKQLEEKWARNGQQE
jgi:integrase